MRIVICGSRSIKGDEAIKAIGEGLSEAGWTPIEIISGAAEGVDTAAEEYARFNHIDNAIFPANWKRWGKAAGYKRNAKMVWYARSVEKMLQLEGKDVDAKYAAGVLAVWDGKSSGTKHTIDLATEQNIPVYIKYVTRD